MGFTRAAKTCFGGSQFRFCRLQLRGTCSSGFGRLIGGAFGFAHRLNRLGQRCGSSIAPRGQASFAFRQRGIFFRDARTCGIGIARKRCGMGQILAQFSKPRFGGFKCGAGAAFLGLHAFGFNAAAFECGARSGFIGTRRAQPLFGFMQSNRGGFGFLFCRAGRAARGGKCSCSSGQRGIGACGQQRQPFTFRLPHQARDIAIAIGLPRLALQPLALRIQLAEQILGTRKVGFRLTQLQFRFMAARTQPGNAGGFFQNAAPIIRLGLDQRRHTALADQR